MTVTIQAGLAIVAIGGAVATGLAGCGTQTAARPPQELAPLSPTTIRAAFQRARMAPGIELGYRSRLYRLVRPLPSANVGARVGAVLYHGTLGQGFTLYRETDTPVTKALVFQAATGQYFEGIAVKGPH